MVRKFWGRADRQFPSSAVFMPPAEILLIAQCSFQPPWCHSGVRLTSVLAEERRVAVQADSLQRAEKPSGPQRQLGQL